MEKIKTKLPKNFLDIETAVEVFLDSVGINAFDNYNHRTKRVQIIVKQLWKDFELSKERNGRDAWCESLNLKDIEVKSANINSNHMQSSVSNQGKSFFNKMSYMFDKQDRIHRREYILGYDGLVFSIFFLEKLQIVFWTCDKNTLNEYREIAKKKQNIFLQKWNRIQSEGKISGNDAINIGPKDFNDSTIWNLYYKGIIYKNASLKECKEILGVK